MKTLLLIFATLLGFSLALRECIDRERECAQMGSPFCVKTSMDGVRSTTVNGRSCQNWGDQSPHTHNYGNLGDDNLCRNPDGDDGPWCYTADPDVRWEFCYPPCDECYNEEKQCVKMGTASCKLPNSYSGVKNVTASGKPCQVWSSQSPNVHQYGRVGNHNSCANPNGRDGPWCFVDDPDNRGIVWEYCFNDCSSCLCPDEKIFGADQDFGEILSPRKIQNYCEDLNCKWRIEPGAEGTGIALSLNYFDTYSYRPDYLDIFYTRPNGERLKIERLQGSPRIGNKPIYVFEGNGAVELVFNTDGGNRKGFHMSFLRFDLEDAECSCPLRFIDVEDDSENVILMSPGYPKTTCVSAHCKYYLRAVNESKSVRLNFGDLDLNSTGDYIRIFEGNVSRTNLMVRKFNGSNEAPIGYTSAGPNLLMTYSVGSKSDSKGFAARASQVVGPCQKCRNQTFNAQEGWFASPGYPETYCPNQECYYTINLPSPYVAQLKFAELGSVPSGRVVIANSTGSYKEPLIYFENKNSRAGSKPFTVDSNVVHIRWRTEDFHIAKGFNLTYKAIKRSKDCRCPSPNPKKIVEPKGEIEIPACGPMDCFVSLPRPEGVGELFVWLDRFEVSQSESDYLSILSRPYGDSSSTGTPPIFPPVSKMYQTGTIPKNTTKDTVRIGGNAALVHFHSSGAVDSKSGGGIKLRYRWNIQECGRGQIPINATHPTGNLTSPEFPDKYGHNLRCQWTLRAPIGFRVVITVNTLHTESYDKLSVYDAVFPSERQKLSDIHGEISESIRLASNGTAMTLVFRTDSSVSYKGWSLTYFMEPNVKAPPKCSEEAQALIAVQQRLFEQAAQGFVEEFEGLVDLNAIKAKTADLFDCSKLLAASVPQPPPFRGEGSSRETPAGLLVAEDIKSISIGEN